jgi:hypothetical protein
MGPAAVINLKQTVAADARAFGYGLKALISFLNNYG